MTRSARLVDPSYSVQIDFSGIDALQAIRTEKLDRIVRHIQNGMTASEAYAYEGLTDSPFGESQTDSQTEADQAIEQALTALLTKEMQKKKDRQGRTNEDQHHSTLIETAETKPITYFQLNQINRSL